MQTVKSITAKSRQQNIDLATLTPETIEIFQNRTGLDKAAFAIATCGGVGYIPIVPATWGSLVAAGFYALAQIGNENIVVWVESHNFSHAYYESLRALFVLVSLIVLFLVGIWAATRVEKITGIKDPRIVVIDEVLGQFVTFLFIPAGFGLWLIVLGFVAFRVFDVLKPYPADKLEFLPAGLGIMIDDAMAGFYAAAFLAVVCSVYLAFS